MPSRNRRLWGFYIDVFLSGLMVNLALLTEIENAFYPAVALNGLYMLFRDALPGMEGQSIGKKCVKLQVRDEEGKTLAGQFGKAFLRNVLLFTPLLLWEIGQVLRRKTRMGDRIAGTQVLFRKT